MIQDFDNKKLVCEMHNEYELLYLYFGETPKLKSRLLCAPCIVGIFNAEERQPALIFLKDFLINPSSQLMKITRITYILSQYQQVYGCLGIISSDGPCMAKDRRMYVDQLFALTLKNLLDLIKACDAFLKRCIYHFFNYLIQNSQITEVQKQMLLAKSSQLDVLQQEYVALASYYNLLNTKGLIQLTPCKLEQMGNDENFDLKQSIVQQELVLALQPQPILILQQDYFIKFLKLFYRNQYCTLNLKYL